MKMKIDMEHWNKTLGCYRTMNGVVYKWLGGCQWRLATKEEQTIKLIEDKSMPNIKITAEVDGKQVPLKTVSTETFEAIKALEKSKEIPVARVGNWEGRSDKRRLILKISNSIKQTINDTDPYMVAIDLKTGVLSTWWADERDAIRFFDQYQDVRPL